MRIHHLGHPQYYNRKSVLNECDILSLMMSEN
jgi:hypothetical protein